MKFHEISKTLKRTTDAASEPLTYSEAMLHCRYDSTDMQQWFTDRIVVARQYCESYLKRQLINATWKLYLDHFPSDGIELRVPPVSAVSSIIYNDAAGDSQTLSSTLYRTDIVSEPARIEPAYGQAWPATRGQSNDVVVTFTAGYGSSGSSVPYPIKMAMLLLIAHWFEHPEAATHGNMSSIPLGVNSLLDSCAWSKVH